MNRMLALVAVVSLGTGCVVEDRCDVRILWSEFQLSDGSFTSSCDVAGVQWIDVWVDGGNGPDATVLCSSPFVDLRVSDGFHFWSVEGVAADGRIVNRHAFELGDSCGLGAIETTPAQGTVDFQYRFFSGGAPIDPQVCRPGSFLWLSVFDWIANDFAFLSDDVTPPDAFTCGGSFVLEMPAGDYTLDWMEEAGPAPGYALEAADCTNRDFFVDPGLSTPVTVNLDRDATNECASGFLRSSAGASRASKGPARAIGKAPASAVP